MKDLNYLNRHFIYKRDGKIDNWSLMVENEYGNLLGDCEDYSLWVAYHILSNKSWMKLFWNIFTRKLKLHFVTIKSSKDVHVILEHNNRFIDNIFKKWVGDEDITSVYNFKFRVMLPILLIKLCVGKIIKLFN